MATAVHAHSQITSIQTSNSTTYSTVDTISASTLSTAGFAANDEVLILWLCKTSGATRINVRGQYAGTTVLGDGPTNIENGWSRSSGSGRSFINMARVDLGATIGDITIDLRSSSTSSASIQKSQLLVLRLSDFGTENTDWFWNHSTTTVAHTTSYSGTSRASVTWTPSSVEDWVYFAQTHIQVDSTSINYEAQATLDGSVHSGDISMEGESTTEEISLGWHGILESLSAASHTVAIQTRDDATGSNDHIASRLFIFKASTFADLYWDLAGTVAVTGNTDDQVATVTDTLSTAQPIIMWGEANLDHNGVNQHLYAWLENGGTIIEPGDDSTGSPTGRAFDTTDETLLPVLAYDSSETGTLDIDYYVRHPISGDRNALRTSLLVWGLELAGAAEQEITPALTSQLVTTSAPSVDPGAVNIVPALLSQLLSTLAATVAPGQVVVTPSLADSQAVTLAPSVDPGQVEITPALFNGTPLSAYDPEVASSDQFLTPAAFNGNPLSAYDPTVTPGQVEISPALESQTMSGIDPTLTPGQVEIVPALESQTATGFDPVVTAAALNTILPSLESQLATATDPTVTPGAVNIVPSLETQTTSSFAPVVTAGQADIVPSLETQTLSSFDPVVANQAALAILPALASQILTGVDPAIGTSTQTLLPDLVEQLIYGIVPFGDWRVIRAKERGSFWRLPGTDLLVLGWGYDRSRDSSFQPPEAWEECSKRFWFDWDKRNEVMDAVEVAWHFNSGESTATITTLFNDIIDSAGYQTERIDVIPNQGTMT